MGCRSLVSEIGDALIATIPGGQIGRISTQADAYFVHLVVVSAWGLWSYCGDKMERQQARHGKNQPEQLAVNRCRWPSGMQQRERDGQ